MAAGKTYRCPMCGGKGVSSSPNGMQWQKCAMCEGDGQIEGRIGRRPTWYPLQLALAASAGAGLVGVSLTGSIQILGTEDFEWQFVLATYTSASMLITVQDNSSGMFLMVAPNQNSNQGILPITLFAGTAQLPFPIRPSYRIPRKNTLTITANDTSGAANTLNLSFYGNSITDAAPPQVQGT